MYLLIIKDWTARIIKKDTRIDIIFSRNIFIGNDIIKNNNGFLHDSIRHIRHFSLDAHNNKNKIKRTTKGAAISKVNSSTIRKKRKDRSHLSSPDKLLSKTYRILPTQKQFISIMFDYKNRAWSGDAKNVKELLQRMEELYREGNKEMKPTFNCYRAYIDTCARTVAKDLKEQEKILTTVFENCCNDGLLDQALLDSLYHEHLRHNHDLFHDLVRKPRGSGLVGIQDLPLNWRRK